PVAPPALVTPPCHAFVACTPASLFFVFPGLCLPSRPCLPRLAFLALRGGSVPLLATRFPRRLLHCRLSTWTYGGPARVSGQGRERYIMLFVDDYTRYKTVFPLRIKGEVPGVLIPWIRAVRLQLREWFCEDLPILRLHSDRGGEFSSDLLRDFCRGEGILKSFTLLASPQQNGVAERRIGLVMEVARTCMIHAVAPHFLWPFAGPAPLGVSQVDPLPGTVLVEVAVDSGAARGVASGGAESGAAEPVSAEPGGAEPEGSEPGGAESEGAESRGAESEGAEPGGADFEGAESRGCGV
ncbi:unnamed protein product, partial [Closterium sp. NIES-54]